MAVAPRDARQYVFGRNLEPRGRGGLARCWVLRERASAPLDGPTCTRRPASDHPLSRTAAGLLIEKLRAGAEPGDRDRPSLENCTVDASIFYLCGQVFKGARWMPWHQEPMKDVGTCDKPRGVGNRTVIRGFPNGETRLDSFPVTHA